MSTAKIRKVEQTHVKDAQASARTLAFEDVTVPSPGNDGISSLRWSRPRPDSRPTNKTAVAMDFLVSTNWDGGVRWWEVQRDVPPHGSGPAVIRVTPKAMVSHANLAPVLDCCFSSDGLTVFSGGCDKAIRMWRLDTPMLQKGQNLAPQIGVHDAPVKAVRFLEDSNLVASGGWDKKMKLWDPRIPNKVARQFDLPERVYSIDVSETGKFMVVATAGRHILEYDVRGAEYPRAMSHFMSSSRFETRIVKCFPTNNGMFGGDPFHYIVGSLEGRLALAQLNGGGPKASNRKKPVLCWADTNPNACYSVNALAFHCATGSLATGTSKGQIKFWDLKLRKRIASFPKLQYPVSCAEFNNDGELFAYASSYDWSKGCDYYATGTPNEIFIHRTPAASMTPRKA